MDPALKTMLTETLLHQAYLGQDAYGKPHYGSPVPRPGRLEYRLTTGTAAQAERVSLTVAFLDADFDLDVRDKLTLPDGSVPAIQEVQSVADPLVSGVVDHYKVIL
jgi:hypothetical protein